MFFLFFLLVCFFVTIPPRWAFSFPDLKPRPPIFQEVKLDIPDPEIYPVKNSDVPAPNFSARSVMAVDVDSKAVILMKNPNEHLYPASTTKMITALVARDQYDMEKVASVSSPIRIGQIMGLYQDEQIKILNILRGTLIYSANDGAEALANLYPGGRDGFITLMNDKVRYLGLTDTHFVNPTGIDQYNHYSTVHDLAIIAAEVMSHPFLREIVGTKSLIVTDESGEIVHELNSTNKLLGKVEGMKGVKTGWTDYAGECLVTYTERNDHRVITAMLGSMDRFGETERLIEWVFGNHVWEEVELAE